MAQIIEMPKLSDTMEEGAVASWLKNEGDFIEEGEAFVEIETDKATMEYNSPEEGYLLKILVASGKSCDLSAPICVVGEKGESFDLDSLLASSVDQPNKETAPKDGANSIEDSKVPVQHSKHSDNHDRIKVSPLARKLAKEKGIDLSKLHGSGPNGRIVQKDIEHSINSSSGLGATASASRGAPNTTVSKAEYEDVANSMMRKTIAKRLLSGKNDAPHFYLKRSVNMKNLMEWRKLMNGQVSSTGGDTGPIKVSINDLIVQASARALSLHPDVNASWQGDSIRKFSSADISVAVAIPDGLITPVVRRAHELGAREIAQATKDLVGRAKAGSLSPEEYQGGTFSISNLGMMGIEEFTAIINPPQAAILAVGATINTPWVAEDGQIEVQPRMKLTMSCDHRVVDGAVGALFLQTLCGYLENPAMMLA